jgi:hypothetical protein
VDKEKANVVLDYVPGGGSPLNSRVAAAIVLLSIGLLISVAGLGIAGLAFMFRWAIPVDPIGWAEFLSAWILGMGMVCVGWACAAMAVYLCRWYTLKLSVRSVSWAISGWLLFVFVTCVGDLRSNDELPEIAAIFLTTPLLLVVLSWKALPKCAESIKQLIGIARTARQPPPENRPSYAERPRF